ncbi:nucleotide disphospho-sugar-binding domain-containing protein [Methylobacterium sp. Leaf91]|uniref:glycosyltransferase n=1 Tax=Methylobacterium sp. Leaf91 TaxID=1736247 RepID=UPI0012E90A39|nr:nucleotide disphospho-sugar-binding domain-containing protein [Methylobacterium sp. Leaf91]
MALPNQASAPSWNHRHPGHSTPIRRYRTGSQNGQIPDDLPASVFRAAYAPLSALLPYSAALIHHGGIGTVAEGLAAGVPQLIVPVAFDHFDEGERLRRLGVGMTLSRRRFKPSHASQCLNTLLHSPTVAEACKEAKKRSAQENGIKVCCGIIERFSKRKRHGY